MMHPLHTRTYPESRSQGDFIKEKDGFLCTRCFAGESDQGILDTTQKYMPLHLLPDTAWSCMIDLLVARECKVSRRSDMSRRDLKTLSLMAKWSLERLSHARLLTFYCGVGKMIEDQIQVALFISCIGATNTWRGLRFSMLECCHPL